MTASDRSDIGAAAPLSAAPNAVGSDSARRGAPTFRWSWKLVRVAGIDVYIHGTFLLLIAFLAISGLVGGQGVTARVRGTMLILAVFSTVVLHEFGHALTARHFGVATRDITLLPIGGVARLEKMPDKPSEQLLVAFAGPAVNLAIALLLIGLVGLFWSPLLMVIAVFIWLGAQAEHSASKVDVALGGLSVRHGMITDFESVSSAEPISRAIELTLAGFQQDFPVMDGDGLLGVLTHADVLKGLAERGADLPVREAMRGEPETASPSEALDGALTRMHRARSRVLTVVRNEKVVGFPTLGNIGELLALQAAGRRPGASASGAGDGTGR